MVRRRVFAALLFTCAVVTTADAQGIGGMIRKKVESVAKPKDEAQKTEASLGERSTAFDYTPGTMASFKRGLELEARIREDYRRQVAALKTPDQYTACQGQISSTPEAMKILEEMGVRKEKAKTTEEITKVSEWMGGEFKKLILKRCGEDPGPLRQRQQEVFLKATEAGASEFAKGWEKKTPSPEEPADAAAAPLDVATFACAEGESDVTSDCDAGHSAVVLPLANVRLRADTTSDEEKQREYAVLKERVEKYCSLSKEMQADAEKNGIRVPGTGKDIYWVFPRGFAIWVGPDCDHLMKLFKLVT